MNRLGLLYIAIVLIAACTDVDCPYIDTRLCDRAYRDSIANLEPDTNAQQLPDTGSIVNGFVQYNAGFFESLQRNVLLEYFTGFRCSNCPPASATAYNLKSQHSNRLVLVYLHATSTFAAPIAQPPAMYSTDFRTQHGEQLLVAFQLTGLPTGAVSRRNFGTGIGINPGDWSERIDELMQSAPQAFIQIRRVKYDPSTAQVKVQIAYRLLGTAQVPSRLSLGIAEDGLIEAQKDGTQDVFPYTHNNVFRGNANGLYGDVVLLGSEDPGPGRAYYADYTISLPQQWNANNCRVFAYLHNEVTLEVMQVAERAVIP